MAAFISAFVMAASVVSCGKKKDSTKEAKTADKVISNSYSSVELDTDMNLTSINKMEYMQDSGKLFISGYYYDRTRNDGGMAFYIASPDFSDAVKVELPDEKPENGESEMYVAPSSDGNIWVLYSVTDYGDYKRPDFDDPDFDGANFNYDEMMQHASYKFILKKFDPQGKELMSNEMKGIDEFSDGSEYGMFVQEISELNGGNLLIRISAMMDKNIIVTPEGECKGTLELDEMSIYNTSAAADGRIAVMGFEESGTKIRYADPETMEADGDAIESGELNTINFLIKGSGDYNIFALSGTALLGITKDGKVKEVVNWVDSDLGGSYVESVVALENGEFLISSNGQDGVTFYKLSARSKDDLKNTKVITVAMMYADSTITGKISDFNKKNNGYRITVEDYSKYYEYDDKNETLINSPSKQMQLDIMSGKSPDMIITYDHSIITELAAKGLFTDLYPLLDDSSDLSRDDILPNVLKANEINGKLCSIAPSFYINTLTARKEFVDKQGWSLSELIDTYDKYKDKMSFSENDTKDLVMNVISGYSHQFADYEKGTCSFDSPEFIKLLEFCNQFPSSDEKFGDGSSDDGMIDDNFTIDAGDYEKGQLDVRNGKVLVSELYLSSPRDYAYEKQGKFGTDITMAGYPGVEGTGAVLSFDNYFAVLDSSPNKEQCWNFISQFFSKEYDHDLSYNFPSTKAAFDKCIEESMAKPYYIDSETNKKVEYDDTYYIGGKEIKIKPLTKEEADFLSDYIKNTTAIFETYSEDTLTILIEEVNAYFAGEKTAEEAADMLQNRVSLLISEQS